jgi:hypothetical protein
MRQAIDELDRQFADLHQQTTRAILEISADELYTKPSDSADSFGEQVLRSAAAVEQSFGGLTANLWDDPFEWTLPENLNTPARVLDYLREVEETRQRAFKTIKSDEDFAKQIMTPTGTVELGDFLLDTFARARHHLQRAVAVLDVLTTDD